MLFLLSSDVQSGKTRWLEKLVSEIEARGASCAGVLAPGVWRELDDGEFAEAQARARKAGESVDEVSRYEKLGIDNVLLPSRERISFGRRTDLARSEGLFDQESLSSRARLDWTIFDDAVARVNGHFDELDRAVAAEHGPVLGQADALERSAAKTAFLIVDEIGRLELLHGGGLVSAMNLLEKGASPAYPHALIVVRSRLADMAEERFAAAWGECMRVAPTEEDAVRLLEKIESC